MSDTTKNKIAYIVACVNEFAHSTGLKAQEAFQYLSRYGGIDFLDEHYEAEHLLSFDEAVEDLLTVSRLSGGNLT
ncbi:MAG: DUF3791 domain-containing protein [Coriobacteriales bacterium]|jgi:hypothetical protein|nr:DUF3791 domain-containing protein [Coriobacteriales bacterium]